MSTNLTLDQAKQFAQALPYDSNLRVVVASTETYKLVNADEYAPQPGESYWATTPSVISQIQNRFPEGYLSGNSCIKLIKLLRTIDTNLGLREAKDVADYLLPSIEATKEKWKQQISDSTALQDNKFFGCDASALEDLIEILTNDQLNSEDVKEIVNVLIGK
jgi:hypothetical protein